MQDEIIGRMPVRHQTLSVVDSGHVSSSIGSSRALACETSKGVGHLL